MRKTTRRRYTKIYREYEQMNADGYRYAIICRRIAHKWCISERTVEFAIQWGRRNVD